MNNQLNEVSIPSTDDEDYYQWQEEEEVSGCTCGCND